jgi:hypothetical protein
MTPAGHPSLKESDKQTSAQAVPSTLYHFIPHLLQTTYKKLTDIKTLSILCDSYVLEGPA